MSKRDNEIITKYSSGDHASLVCNIAELHGGIDRVDNDEFIFADGVHMYTEPKSMFERWAEDEASRPADWLQIAD